MGRNHRTIAHKHEPLHHVLQFPHIPRPGICLKNLHEFRLQLLDRLLVRRAVQSQEVLDQQRNIALTVAQRGHEDRDHMNAVIEILAESANAYHGVKVVVGCRDEPEVNFLRGPSSQPLHHAVLKNAQKFALQAVVQRRDLVQEKSPCLRSLNHARLRRISAREGTLLIAEQLRFDQTLRKCRAVEANIRLIATLSRLHDRVRDEFLAYAALAPNHHVGIRPRHRLDRAVNLAHCLTSADQACKC